MGLGLRVSGFRVSGFTVSGLVGGFGTRCAWAWVLGCEFWLREIYDQGIRWSLGGLVSSLNSELGVLSIGVI